MDCGAFSSGGTECAGRFAGSGGCAHLGQEESARHPPSNIQHLTRMRHPAAQPGLSAVLGWLGMNIDPDERPRIVWSRHFSSAYSASAHRHDRAVTAGRFGRSP
jgi:hypothetical protein